MSKNLLESVDSVNRVAESTTAVAGMSFGEFFTSMLSGFKPPYTQNIDLRTELFSWAKYVFAIGFFISAFDFLTYLWEFARSSNKAGNLYGLLRRGIQLPIALIGGFFVGAIAFFSIEFIVLAFTAANVWDALVSFVDAGRNAVKWALAENSFEAEAYKNAFKERFIRGIISLLSAAALAACLIFKVHYVLSLIFCGAAFTAGAFGLGAFIKFKWSASHLPKDQVIQAENLELSKEARMHLLTIEATYLPKSWGRFDPMAGKDRFNLFNTLSGIEERKDKNEKIRYYYKHQIDTRNLWVNIKHIADFILSVDQKNFLNDFLNSDITKTDQNIKIESSNKTGEIKLNEDWATQLRQIILNTKAFENEKYNYRPALTSMSEKEYLVELVILAMKQKIASTVMSAPVKETVSEESVKDSALSQEHASSIDAFNSFSGAQEEYEHEVETIPEPGKKTLGEDGIPYSSKLYQEVIDACPNDPNFTRIQRDKALELLVCDQIKLQKDNKGNQEIVFYDTQTTYENVFKHSKTWAQDLKNYIFGKNKIENSPKAEEVISKVCKHLEEKVEQLLANEEVENYQKNSIDANKVSGPVPPDSSSDQKIISDFYHHSNTNSGWENFADVLNSNSEKSASPIKIQPIAVVNRETATSPIGSPASFFGEYLEGMLNQEALKSGSSIPTLNSTSE